MYSLAPEKTRRLVYEPFYLAIIGQTVFDRVIGFVALQPVRLAVRWAHLLAFNSMKNYEMHKTRKRVWLTSRSPIFAAFTFFVVPSSRPINDYLVFAVDNLLDNMRSVMLSVKIPDVVLRYRYIENTPKMAPFVIFERQQYVHEVSIAHPPKPHNNTRSILHYLPIKSSRCFI